MRACDKPSGDLTDQNKAKILKGISRGERAIREACVVSHADAKKVLFKWLKSVD